MLCGGSTPPWSELCLFFFFFLSSFVFSYFFLSYLFLFFFLLFFFCFLFSVVFIVFSFFFSRSLLFSFFFFFFFFWFLSVSLFLNFYRVWICFQVFFTQKRLEHVQFDETPSFHDHGSAVDHGMLRRSCKTSSTPTRTSDFPWSYGRKDAIQSGCS